MPQVIHIFSWSHIISQTKRKKKIRTHTLVGEKPSCTYKLLFELLFVYTVQPRCVKIFGDLIKV